jgi:C1A family cysteine protease
MSLSAVLKAIKTKNSTWTASETPLSKLPETARKRMLGLIVSEEELAKNKVEIATANALAKKTGFAAPAKCDWRKQNGKNWITPVKDQKQCGACVAFSVCAVMETRARIKANNANLAVNLSENQLFFCGCPKCCNVGWHFEAALNFAKSTGVAAESDSSYTPSNKPCPSASPTMKVTRWKALRSVAERKESLAQRGPIIAGMRVFEDFYVYSSGVYQHVQGGFLGNHAITIVGYDDTKHCWICKNSWGAGWGEGGFFRVAYEDSCGIDTLFPSYELDVADVGPPPTPGDCSTYLPLLERALNSAQTNHELRAALRFYVCDRGQPPVMTAARTQIVQSVLLILRHCPQYKETVCARLG